MRDASPALNRRTLIRHSLAALALPAGRLALPLAAVTGREALAQAPGEIPARGTHLLLLGTQGGPNFNATRGECASALIVDGRIYLVDCGYGAMMSLFESGLNYRDIGHVFVTHLHDDHVADLAALLSHQWTGGRIEPTIVIGPHGTEALVDAALAFSEANTRIRLVDEARSTEPATLFSGRDIEAPPEPAPVFDDDRVRVSAVENTHYPAESKTRLPDRAVSFRFDTVDRSIVISGDTAYSEALIELARGADVLVCETMEIETLRVWFDRFVAAGAYADNPEGVWTHIVDTHATTEDAGRMAAAAGVDTLVLTHLLPGALMDVDDSLYLEGVRRHFDGEVIVGRDLLLV